MTENAKRTILCCAFGWFLGGTTKLDHAMCIGAVVLFVLRMALLDADGHPRKQRKERSPLANEAAPTKE